MPVSNLVRTGGGLASIAAGILLLLGHLLDLGGDSDYGTVLGGALVLAAHLVLVELRECSRELLPCFVGSG